MSNSGSGHVTFPAAIKNESDQSDIDPESTENSNNIGGDFIIEEKFIPEDPPEPYKLFICKFCSQLFKIKRHLTTHLRRNCKKKPTNYCKLCRKNFTSSSDYSDHLKACQDYYKLIGNCDGRFVCPTAGCLAEFKTQDSLNCHRNFVHTDRRHICQLCGFKFKTLSAKKTHERVTCHPNGGKEPLKKRKSKSRGKPPPKKQIKLEKDDQNDLPAVSGRPRRSTRREVDYAKLDSLDGEDSDSSGSSETSATASLDSILGGNDQDDLGSDSDEEMSNSDCTQDSISQTARRCKFKGHRGRNSTNSKIFNCSNCPQNFDSEKAFKDHGETCIQITVEDFLKCPRPDCSEKFPIDALTDYNQHISKHGPPRVHKSYTLICSICKSSWFKSQQKFEDHCSLPHPFPCKVKGCSLKYITKKELDFHTKKKHLDEKRTFKCTQENCEFKFTNKHRLKCHILGVHQKKYAMECPVCLEILSNRGKLCTHLKRHKNPGRNKPECEICHVFFPKRSQLKAHIEKSEIHSKKVEMMENNAQEEYIIPNDLEDLNPIDSLLDQYSGPRKEIDSGILEESDSETESFPCKKCDLSFKSSYFRVKHLLTDHKVNETTLPPYYQSSHCEICNITFKYKRSYDCHVSKSLTHKARLKEK